MVSCLLNKLTNDNTSDKFKNICAMDKNTPFPECAKNCEVIKMLGVGECESVCGHKFDTSERQLTIPCVYIYLSTHIHRKNT